MAGPLAGLIVVDLTRVLAGPFCTMLLADLGARVIKVEPPAVGDDARAFGPFVNGKSAYFMSINRAKESIALDLKAPADRAIFEDLLGEADVLIENYRGGTMEKLGYGWDTLHPRFPRLVYAACSGFGHTGPLATRAAYDMVVQAMGGVMSLTGHPGTPPTRVGVPIGDLAAGLFTAIGINAALVERASTGVGRKVDIGMLDAQVALMENAIARFEATSKVPGLSEGRHPSITPFAAFRTADHPIVISAGNDGLFRTLSKTLGQPGWPDDPRFKTNADRTANHEALGEAIEAVLASRGSAEWLALLDAAGIPCGPINDTAMLLAEPQVAARNMLVTTEDPAAGTVRMAGNPIKLSDTPDPPTRAPAPDLDQHRSSILSELSTWKR